MLHTGYDELMEKYRGDVPLAYMRALAYKESSLDPKQTTPDGGAIGLYQIRGVALKEYNQANKTNYTKQDLFNPEINIKIAGWFLNNVIAHWKDRPSLIANWNNERFPAILAFGYNAGWSDKAGIEFVVKQIEATGVAPNDVTVDLIRDVALITPKASKYLTMKNRSDWAKKVASVFLNKKPTKQAIVKEESSSGLGWLAAGAALAGLWALSRKG